ncbi:hypothetical protein Ddye_017027 [Dipteronia dyeriana]|uniref:HAT C-terminal dimerisation domain-containing protein n=1 Tax=Dipteronia dyeriana TaxID=168575 RepID=A0AAD9U8J7_9ROSI|nr:hypothetical protein Ddye_017027 [Dipteronia dyeriana]
MICKVRETMNGWLNSRYNEIQVMARGMIAKFDKYLSDIPGVMAVVVVLDPRYKMLLVDFHFSKIYGSSASSQREIVYELLKDLIKEYELGSSLVEQLDDNSLDHSFDIFVGDEEFELYKSQAVSSINKSELERYLEEQVENNSPDFDILSWWKGNKGKYPILAKVARDILAISVSTVASEFALNAGGRFLSPHRRRLHPDTLEALMCKQNWIWALIRGGIPEEEIYATIDEEEPLASI